MKECCREYLNEEFGGDADIVNDIYGEYVKSAAEKADEAKRTLAAGDWEALDKVAHTIKGNALMVGDQEMADTAIALRSIANLHEQAAAEAKIAEIDALLKLL